MLTHATLDGLLWVFFKLKFIGDLALTSELPDLLLSVVFPVKDPSG